MIASDPAVLWYALFRTRGLGTKTLNRIHGRLVHAGVSLSDAWYLDWPEFHALVPDIPREVYASLRSGPDSKAGDELDVLGEHGIRLIHPEHQDYPQQLRGRLSGEAPALLFCWGYTGLLSAPAVAIVGSRHASEPALTFASTLARELALEGFNVVSGYAAGVDTAAHLGALTEDGTTTMVLSEGILHFRRKGEFRDVSWDGNVLAVSQFHPREKWLARNAMARNKPVCALSSAVVVVEAGERVDAKGRMSGTFNAGELALSLGVPLFVLDPVIAGDAAAGNVALLRGGGLTVRPETALRVVLDTLRPEAADTQLAEPVATGRQERLF